MGAGPSFILSTSIAAVLSSYFTESNFNKIKGLKDRRTTLIGKGQSFIWIEEAACFSIYGPCWTIWEPFDHSRTMLDLFGIIFDPLGTNWSIIPVLAQIWTLMDPLGTPLDHKGASLHLGILLTQDHKEREGLPICGPYWTILVLYSIIWAPLVNLTWSYLQDHFHPNDFLPGAKSFV